MKEQVLRIGLLILASLLVFGLLKMLLASVFWMLRLVVTLVICLGIFWVIQKFWK